MYNASQIYQTNAVQTASPQELSLMLYNGCLKFIKLASRALEEKNIEQKHIHLVKAQAIITQFRITLDMDIPISKDLDALYMFINEKLIEANTTNNQETLALAEDLVRELRDTWKTMMTGTVTV
ncbi:flagellar protein FliS [Chryseomicrobium aureum]|uniref:flagellar export chaperone FliS n=1 Tax=Chryseomicrobium aureum TaxID=1441723 RepID=UPI00195956BB|nr:flagellar protein FliS [Chryseomicrobium aureum]